MLRIIWRTFLVFAFIFLGIGYLASLSFWGVDGPSTTSVVLLLTIPPGLVLGASLWLRQRQVQ